MAGYFSLIWKTWKLDSAVHIYIKKPIIIIHLYLLSILTYLIMGYLLRVALCGIVLLRK